MDTHSQAYCVLYFFIIFIQKMNPIHIVYSDIIHTLQRKTYIFIYSIKGKLINYKSHQAGIFRTREIDSIP